jgi:hypothetical protein
VKLNGFCSALRFAHKSAADPFLVSRSVKSQTKSRESLVIQLEPSINWKLLICRLGVDELRVAATAGKLKNMQKQK